VPLLGGYTPAHDLRPKGPEATSAFSGKQGAAGFCYIKTVGAALAPGGELELSI